MANIVKNHESDPKQSNPAPYQTVTAFLRSKQQKVCIKFKKIRKNDTSLSSLTSQKDQSSLQVVSTPVYEATEHFGLASSQNTTNILQIDSPLVQLTESHDSITIIGSENENIFQQIHANIQSPRDQNNEISFSRNETQSMMAKDHFPSAQIVSKPLEDLDIKAKDSVYDSKKIDQVNTSIELKRPMKQEIQKPQTQKQKTKPQFNKKSVVEPPVENSQARGHRSGTRKLNQGNDYLSTASGAKNDPRFSRAVKLNKSDLPTEKAAKKSRTSEATPIKTPNLARKDVTINLNNHDRRKSNFSKSIQKCVKTTQLSNKLSPDLRSSTAVKEEYQNPIFDEQVMNTNNSKQMTADNEKILDAISFQQDLASPLETTPMDSKSNTRLTQQRNQLIHGTDNEVKLPGTAEINDAKDLMIIPKEKNLNLHKTQCVSSRISNIHLEKPDQLKERNFPVNVPIIASKFVGQVGLVQSIFNIERHSNSDIEMNDPLLANRLILSPQNLKKKEALVIKSQRDAQNTAGQIQQMLIESHPSLSRFKDSMEDNTSITEGRDLENTFHLQSMDNFNSATSSNKILQHNVHPSFQNKQEPPQVGQNLADSSSSKHVIQKDEYVFNLGSITSLPTHQQDLLRERTTQITTSNNRLPCPPPVRSHVIYNNDTSSSTQSRPNQVINHPGNSNSMPDNDFKQKLSSRHKVSQQTLQLNKQIVTQNANTPRNSQKYNHAQLPFTSPDNLVLPPANWSNQTQNNIIPDLNASKDDKHNESYDSITFHKIQKTSKVEKFLSSGLKNQQYQQNNGEQTAPAILLPQGLGKSNRTQHGSFDDYVQEYNTSSSMNAEVGANKLNLSHHFPERRKITICSMDQQRAGEDQLVQINNSYREVSQDNSKKDNTLNISFMKTKAAQKQQKLLQKGSIIAKNSSDFFISRAMKNHKNFNQPKNVNLKRICGGNMQSLWDSEIVQAVCDASSLKMVNETDLNSQTVIISPSRPPQEEQYARQRQHLGTQDFKMLNKNIIQPTLPKMNERYENLSKQRRQQSMLNHNESVKEFNPILQGKYQSSSTDQRSQSSIKIDSYVSQQGNKLPNNNNLMDIEARERSVSNLSIQNIELFHKTQFRQTQGPNYSNKKTNTVRLLPSAQRDNQTLYAKSIKSKLASLQKRKTLISVNCTQVQGEATRPSLQ